MIILYFVILFLVDCEINGYIEGECSVLCGTGVKTISPNIIQHPQFGGKPCPPDEVVPCVGEKCPRSIYVRVYNIYIYIYIYICIYL